MMDIVEELQSGPCVICGDVNYPLSVGGPTICPSCDCGDFGLAKVRRQAVEIARLTVEVQRLRIENAALRRALETKP